MDAEFMQDLHDTGAEATKAEAAFKAAQYKHDICCRVQILLKELLGKKSLTFPALPQQYTVSCEYTIPNVFKMAQEVAYRLGFCLTLHKETYTLALDIARAEERARQQAKETP